MPGYSKRHRWAWHRFTVNETELHVLDHVVGTIKLAFSACRQERFTNKLFHRTRLLFTAVVAEGLGRQPDDTFITNITGGRIGNWSSMSTPAMFPLHPVGSTEWSHAPSHYQESVQEDAHIFCQGRSFFTTNTGPFGSGPRNMEEGDTCCVIHGACVPMILRERSSGNCVLVGEAHVEGIMFGIGHVRVESVSSCVYKLLCKGSARA